MDLIDAVCSKNYAIVEAFVRDGENPDMTIDKDLLRPLHFAILAEDVYLVKILLVAGANPHIDDALELPSPYVSAIQSNCKDIANLMMSFCYQEAWTLISS